jgi:MFS transporter, DHA1 family, multidrug resistance protein
LTVPDAEPASAYPSGSRLWLVILGGVAAGAPLAIDSYLPAFPSIAHDFDASAAAVQFTLTTFFVGMLVGLLLVGPLSDALGRRPPLLTGLALFSAASLACALAPSVHLLAVARVFQGAAVGTGMALESAIVRDVSAGRTAARHLATILLVSMLAPILAPLIGSQVLQVASWRWLFIGLAIYGVVWCIVTAIAFDETLPAARRRRATLVCTLGMYWGLLSNRLFLGYSLPAGLIGAAFFAYLAGSSLVLQDAYGLSPQMFGLVFALNAVGLSAAAQFNRLLHRWFTLQAVMLGGLLAAAASGIVLLIAVAGGAFGLAGVLVPLFLLVSALGLIYPNALALAMNDHPGLAGGASSIMNLLQIGLGAAVAPIAGISGGDSGLSLAIVVAALAVAAPVTFLLLAGRVGGSGADAEGVRRPGT